MWNAALEKKDGRGWGWGEGWYNVFVSRSVEMEGMRKKTRKGRRPLYVGREDVKHVLLDRFESVNCRKKFLN
jgi:hypothetical protein